MNNINTKDLEQEYQDTLAEIEDAVEQLSLAGRLPIGFEFSVKTLDKLEEILHCDDFYDERYLFGYIKTVKEVHKIYEYLISYKLSHRRWFDGTILYSYPNAMENARNLIDSNRESGNLSHYFTEYQSMVNAEMDDCIVVSYWGVDYWVSI
jgi:hypothetical protein